MSETCTFNVPFEAQTFGPGPFALVLFHAEYNASRPPRFLFDARSDSEGNIKTLSERVIELTEYRASLSEYLKARLPARGPK